MLYQPFQRHVKIQSVESKDPELPDSEKIYIAEKLYRENVGKRKALLIEDGYELEESCRACGVQQAIATDNPPSYKYELTVLKSNKKVISVTVIRDSIEEATQIGLEAAFLALREKAHLSRNASAHTGLATFTAKLKNSHSVKYANSLTVSPKRIHISSFDAWYKIIDMLVDDDFKVTQTAKKNIKFTHNTNINREDKLEQLKELLTKAFPEITLSNDGQALIVRNASKKILGLVNQMKADRFI